MIIRVSLTGILVVAAFQYLHAVEPIQSVEALRVWEEVLNAKGGRKRLYEIASFIATNPRPKEPKRPFSVELYVFPNSQWSWFDQGKSPLSGDVRVSDGVNSWMATAPHNGERSKFYKLPNTDAEVLSFRIAHAKYLLETKWFQPKLIKLDSTRIGREEFAVITARLGEDKLSANDAIYYIDSNTHLVRRVIFGGTWEFEDYRAVQGIMMATRERYINGKARFDYTPKFSFDVEYDPTLFAKRPSIEAGPDGWKPPR